MGPFTGRQLTTIVIAVCLTIVMMPATVWAVDAFSDVAIQDPVSGNNASVDATHHRLVGDGSGPLTVDGTVYAPSGDVLAAVVRGSAAAQVYAYGYQIPGASAPPSRPGTPLPANAQRASRCGRRRPARRRARQPKVADAGRVT